MDPEQWSRCLDGSGEIVIVVDGQQVPIIRICVSDECLINLKAVQAFQHLAKVLIIRQHFLSQVEPSELCLKLQGTTKRKV